VSALEHSPLEPGDYEVAQPQPSLMLKDAILKWYDVAPPDEPVPLAIRALARRCLRDGAKDGTLGVEEGLGFIVLHRCDEELYVLHVSTWDDEHELSETLWAKSGEDVLFRPCPGDTPHRVEEFVATAHEREAWSAYLRSARDEAARRAYLRDSYAGVV
jgi:hypothetical protein